jgi:hypothetical protein
MSYGYEQLSKKKQFFDNAFRLKYFQVSNETIFETGLLEQLIIVRDKVFKVKPQNIKITGKSNIAIFLKYSVNFLMSYYFIFSYNSAKANYS